MPPASLFSLEFAKRFLLLAFGLAAVGAVFFFSQQARYATQRRSEAEALVRAERQILLESLQGTVADIRFLAQLFECPNRPDRENALPGEETLRLLRAFLRARPQYTRLRLLAPDGEERLHLQRLNDAVRLFPSDGTSGAVLDPSIPAPAHGEVVFAPFALGERNGIVERPFRPALSAITSVRISGKGFGEAILTLDGRRILDRLRNLRHAPGVRILLVNGEGHWLLGPSRHQEWGNSLPERQPYTLAARHPELWMLIGSQPEGVFRNDTGLFAFSRLDLSPETFGPDVGGEDEWTLLAFVPDTMLRPEWSEHFLLLGIVVLALVTLASALLTRSLLHRRRAEQDFQESEEKIQAISHSSHDGLIMVDERGSVVFWNPAAEAMLGHTAAEVLNQPAIGFLAAAEPTVPGPVPALKAGPFSASSDGSPLFLRRKDGSVFPAEVALSSFRLHGSWWTVNAVRDITKRMAALTELEKNREMLVEAQSISRMGGFSLTAGGDDMDWTDEMRQLHGVGRDFRPSSTAMADFVEPSHREAFLNALGEARKGNVVELEQPLRTAKGRRIWVRMNIRPHFSGDKVSRLSGIYQDVTDRKLERIRMEQLSTAVEHSPASVLITNAEGMVEYVNPMFTEVCGYKPSEIIGNGMDLLNPEGLGSAFFERMRGEAEPGGHWSGEIGTRTKDGRRIWQRLSISPIQDDEGEVRHFVGIMEDVTERRKSVEALQASERKIRAMSEAMLDAMVVIDGQARIAFWNPAASRIFGYEENEALGRDVHDLIAASEEALPGPEAMARFAESGSGPVVGVTRELTAVRKDGSQFPCEITVSSFSFDTQWYAVGTIRDITRRKEYERRLRSLATTDELTGLLNRRALLELAESELDRSRRYGRPFSLLMLDLDHFKRVNDTYGHDVGDRVLQAVAGAGSDALRETDTLGRLGGEEFAAILPETGAGQAREVAERLRAAVAGAEVVAEAPGGAAETIRVTISVGIAEFRADRDTVESILKAADTALYRAKELGRNRSEIA